MLAGGKKDGTGERGQEAAHLSQKVAIEENLRHDAASNYDAVAVGDVISQALQHTNEAQTRAHLAKVGRMHLLDPGLRLIGWAVHIEPILKRGRHYDAAARVGQVVREFGAVEAASEEMRLVGVDGAGFSTRAHAQGTADEFAGGGAGGEAEVSRGEWRRAGGTCWSL